MASEVIAPAPTDHHTHSSPTNPDGTLATSHSSTSSPSSPRPLFPDSDDAASDSGSEESSSSASRPVTSPVTSPPYWLQGAQTATTGGNGGSGAQAGVGGGGGSRGSHGRSVSNVSVESVVPAGAITLQDNESPDAENGADRGGTHGRDRNRACWAKSVSVTDHVVVNSSATNIGAFVVWNIRVETLSGSHMNIRKRYSEFDELRHRLVFSFPNFEAAVPVLPPKSVISKFRPGFLEKRRAGLQYFLNCILLNPEFSGSPVLKDFLFS